MNRLILMVVLVVLFPVVALAKNEKVKDDHNAAGKQDVPPGQVGGKDRPIKIEGGGPVVRENPAPGGIFETLKFWK